MNKFILLFIVTVFSSLNGQSQSRLPLSIGPFIGMKASTDIVAPENSQTSIKFSDIPDFGATFYVPLSQNRPIALSFDVGYSTYCILYEQKIGATDENTFIEKYSYFSIAPSISYSHFMLGLNFGIPILWTIRNLSNSISFGSDYGEDMLTNIEVRLGGIIPIMHDEIGRLNVVIMGGYMVRKIAKDPPSGTSNNFSPQAASLLLGVNYLFTLKKSE
jgi:hypothetical protein